MNLDLTKKEIRAATIAVVAMEASIRSKKVHPFGKYEGDLATLRGKLVRGLIEPDFIEKIKEDISG
jgi:hypothetical protein